MRLEMLLSPRFNAFCVANALNFTFTSFPDSSVRSHGGAVFSACASSPIVRDFIVATKEICLGRSSYHLHRSVSAAAEAVSRLPSWPPCWELVVFTAASDGLGFPGPGSNLAPLPADVAADPPEVHVTADQPTTCLDSVAPANPRMGSFGPSFLPSARPLPLPKSQPPPTSPSPPIAATLSLTRILPAGVTTVRMPPSPVMSCPGHPRFPPPLLRPRRALVFSPHADQKAWERRDLAGDSLRGPVRRLHLQSGLCASIHSHL
jgi:hypothetical protein